VTRRLRLNHLFDLWAVWVIALFVIANAVTTAIWPDLDTLLTWTVMWPVVILHAVGLLTLARKHESIACDICRDRFLVVPGDDTARRARPYLILTHVVMWLSDRLRKLGFDALGAGIIAAMALVVAVTSIARLIVPAHWTGVVAILFVIFFVHSVRRHSQLQPWCPWCRRGGTPEDEPEVPDPQPSTGRDLALEGAK